MCQKRRYLITGIVFLIIMLCGQIEQVQAQQKYPTKSIDIIGPFSPGGATDLSARLMGDYMSKKWGVPIMVVNKPGGLHVPACLELYNAKPDGYTLMLDSVGSSSQLPTVVKNLPFKIIDRTYIGIFTATPSIYIVKPESPIKSLRDLEAEIKKDPGNFTWTSLGGAGGYDVAMRKFLNAIGVDVKKTKPVVVKGGPEGVNLTTAGTVKLGFGTISSSGPSIAAKIVRPLAVTSHKRLSSFPDIPTAAEAGYPTAFRQDRYGPSGPPNVPSYIVETWNKALEVMLKDPEVITKMERIGLIPYYLNAHDTRELVLKEIDEFKELYRSK